MAKPSIIVMTLATLGAIGGLAYMHVSRNESASYGETIPRATVPLTELRRSRAEAPPAPAAAAETATEHEDIPARQVETDDVARWIADTQDNDAKTRAAAIEALADAPKARAIPALKRVLESGEPQVDRQIALRSLHVLALNHGDENNAIRDAIRHAMYHSEDEGVTQSAQAFLEDIEAALAERAASASNDPAGFPFARPPD